MRHRRPPVSDLIGAHGYDSLRPRLLLPTRVTAACIWATRSRKRPVFHRATLYRQRHKDEIMFGRLKDWRRITPATTTAPAPSSQPSPSPPSSPSGFNGES